MFSFDLSLARISLGKGAWIRFDDDEGTPALNPRKVVGKFTL
jgi:hypothetical protein